MTLRPVQIDQLFHEMIDAFSVCILGIGTLVDPANLENLKSFSFVPVESSFSPEHSNINVHHYVNRLADHELSASLTQDTLQVLCQALSISAYENLRASPHYAKIALNPVVQFLRHIRNASAHSNVFAFTRSQPDKAAIWRGKEITKALNGSHCFFVFLSPGDLPLLLGDITRLL